MNINYLRQSSLLTLVFLIISAAVVTGQTIEVINKSFEGIPRAGDRGGQGFVATGWWDCGNGWFRGETPADIHPGVPGGFFGVSMDAHEGRTYLGMVVRDNDTWEGVSQRLDAPLEADQCYSFSLDLSRSATYYSPYPYDPNVSESYTKGAVLRIYGGNSYCSRKEVLAESEIVQNASWKRFDFEFRPTSKYNFIIFEAFYKTPVLFPYNGNLLLDNASDIERIACPGEELAQEDPGPDPKKEEPTEIKPKKEDPVVSEKPVVKPDPKPELPTRKKQTVIAGVERANLIKGQKIQISNLYFDADTSKINPNSYRVLDDLAEFLRDNRDVKIEIGGHTNNQPTDEYCDDLSAKRAKSVGTYLIGKGVDPGNLSFKGYGKREPIASNKTKEGRKRNQRVEIKIISLDG